MSESKTVDHLHHVLHDLVSSRQRLKEAMDTHTLQHEVNTTQLDRFDTLIAGVRHNLSDSHALEQIEIIKSTPAAEDVAPLPAAGAGAATEPAPAG